MKEKIKKFFFTIWFLSIFGILLSIFWIIFALDELSYIFVVTPVVICWVVFVIGGVVGLYKEQ